MTSVRSCLVTLKVIGLQLCQAVPSNKNGSKCFAKTISFLFYLYEIYVQLFLRNTLLQISLIESIFYKKINEWYIEWQQVTTSDNEWYNEWQRITTSDKNDNEWYNECQREVTSDRKWQRGTANDNKWQEVTARGKTNENGTIHIEEWMIAIFSVTDSRDWWLQLEWLNKETAPKVFQESSWY